MESKLVNVPPASQKPANMSNDSYLCSAHVSSAENGTSDGREPHRTVPSEETWHPNVNFDHLSEKDQEIVQQMLYEESDMFAHEEGDI